MGWFQNIVKDVKNAGNSVVSAVRSDTSNIVKDVSPVAAVLSSPNIAKAVSIVSPIVSIVSNPQSVEGTIKNAANDAANDVKKAGNTVVTFAKDHAGEIEGIGGLLAGGSFIYIAGPALIGLYFLMKK